MRKYFYINWSEIERNTIIERIEIEEHILNEKINSKLLKEAIEFQDKIRNKTSINKGWSSTEEIRKWRETRK